MIHKLSPQTRTFVLLLFFAFISAYAALTLNAKLNWLSFTGEDNNEAQPIPQETNKGAEKPDTEQLQNPEDLKPENWVRYESKELDISFKHPRNWLVTYETLESGDSLIEIKPAQGEPIKIYVSKDDYYALDGLEYKKAVVGNKNGFTIDNFIYGAKVGTNYYTMDNTYNPSVNKYFMAVVDSVEL